MESICDNIDNKKLIVGVRRMPSHVKDMKHKLVSGVSDFDILANDVVGKYAGEAAG